MYVHICIFVWIFVFNLFSSIESTIRLHLYTYYIMSITYIVKWIKVQQEATSSYGMCSMYLVYTQFGIDSTHSTNSLYFNGIMNH